MVQVGFRIHAVEFGRFQQRVHMAAARSLNRFIYPNLALGLEPILIGMAFASAVPLVEFICSLGDLRCRIDRFPSQ